MNTIKTGEGYIGYLDGNALKQSQEDLNSAERNLHALDGKCSQLPCEADGAVRTEDDGWLCQEHWNKLSR